MENKPKNLIIIVAWNSEKTIEACLKSIIDTSDKKIIVVDNASTDATTEIVRKFSQVKLLENKSNLGYGTAANLGVENTSCLYTLFLNPDCVVKKEAVEKLSSFLDKKNEAAVVSPKLVGQNGQLQREMSPFPTVLSQVLILLRLHRISFFQHIVYPEIDYEKTQEAEHLMGAALMIRRSVFEKLGGFDENFFLWFEETDLLKRISEAGHKIIYYPETSVTHLTGQSTKQLNFFKKQTIWNKSLIYYFSKHKGWVKLLLLVPFIVLSYPAALVSYLIKK